MSASMFVVSLPPSLYPMVPFIFHRLPSHPTTPPLLRFVRRNNTGPFPCLPLLPGPSFRDLVSSPIPSFSPCFFVALPAPFSVHPETLPKGFGAPDGSRGRRGAGDCRFPWRGAGSAEQGRKRGAGCVSFSASSTRRLRRRRTKFTPLTFASAPGPCLFRSREEAGEGLTPAQEWTKGRGGEEEEACAPSDPQGVVLLRREGSLRRGRNLQRGQTQLQLRRRRRTAVATMSTGCGGCLPCRAPASRLRFPREEKARVRPHQAFPGSNSAEVKPRHETEAKKGVPPPPSDPSRTHKPRKASRLPTLFSFPFLAHSVSVR